MEVAVFLRGINVSGHHKVPMAELKACFQKWGYGSIRTLLNTGNVVMEYENQNLQNLAERLEEKLETQFGFAIPVISIPMAELRNLVRDNPFQLQPKGAHIRYYVTFLKELPVAWCMPWESEDGAFQVISVQNQVVCSVLDLNNTQTTQGMALLERRYGKQLTTRNWNTVEKMVLL